MNFGGVSTNDYDGLSVVSVRNAVVPPREDKIISHRGREIAYVSAPSVREIEVELLCREYTGGTTPPPEKASRILGQFVGRVRSYGIDSLIVDSGDRNDVESEQRFYWARLKDVSIPDIRGVSARVTLTFVCVDPEEHVVGDGSTPFDYAANDFTFNGKHCRNDMGCVFVEETRQIPPVLAPKYEVAGTNGTMRYAQDAPTLGEWQLRGTLHFVNPYFPGEPLTENETRIQVQEVSAWFVNAQRGKLVFDADDAYEYEAEVIEAQDIEERDWPGGMVRLVLNVQPVCKRRVESKFTVDHTTYPVGMVDYVDVDMSPSGYANTIGYRTPVKIKIFNTGTTTITKFGLYFPFAVDLVNASFAQVYEDTDEPFTIPPNYVLIIDSEAKTITRWYWEINEALGEIDYFDPVDFSKFPFENADNIERFAWIYAYPPGVTNDNVLHINYLTGATTIRVEVTYNARRVG